MDEAQIDLDVHVGVTLRSLLENRELINSQDNCVNGRIEDNLEHRMRYSDRLNDNYICAAKRSEKEDKEEENGNFDSSAAFLGPTLWDKSDFKLEYVDLDEFLCENGMPHEENQKLDHIVRENTNATQNSHHHHHHHHHQHPQQPEPHTHSNYHHHHHPTIHYDQNHGDRKQEKQISESSPESNEDEPVNDEEELPVECKFTDDDLALATVPGHNNFDPTVQVFSEDELKPQPMVKKSRKHFVPDNMKDEKYWMRRHKNNIAAKRSREARRVKENQIVLRASYLEKENYVLREELEKLRGENKMLRQCLKKYEQ